MPAYTDNTNSPIYIPSNTGKVRIIAVGEGGAGSTFSNCNATNGDDGADTEFMGAVAYGGSAANSFTGGTGGGATFPSSLYGTILSSSAGDDGGNGSGAWNAVAGDGGAGHTFTSPSLGSITKGTGEDGSGTGACRSTAFQDLGGSCASNPCASTWVPPSQPVAWYNYACVDVADFSTRSCYYYYDFPYKGAGGGAGGFIEVEISSPELQSVVLPIIGEYNFAGSNQIYTVNNAGSGELNGFLEVILFLPTVYIKTSSGWELVTNIYVNSNDVGIGWTTSATYVL
jgi:hypothetical protein